MKVEVLHFAGCPNYLPAVDRLKKILRQEGLAAEISEIEVKDEAAAKALGFFGSPTIRVEGLDIDADFRNATGTGFTCRLYSGGAPPEEMIRSALKESRER